MATLRQTPLTCSGHTRPVVDLAFSDITEHGYYLISACKDGKPMLRQGDTGDWVGTFEGHKGAVWGATLNKDGSQAATGAADFSAKIWDAESGSELHSLVHKHIVKAVAFSYDMKSLLTGSNEKILRIFDLNNIDSDPVTLEGHTKGIQSCVWLNDGRRIVSSSDDKTIRMWDIGSKQEVNMLTLPFTPGKIELSRDGEILTVPNGPMVSFYKADSLEMIKEVEIPSQVNSASLHPENHSFVCGGEDFKMYKFDYNTGTEIESFKGHFGPIHCIRFSPDGELYASGSEDGTLRLWQTTIGKTYGLWKCVVPEESNNADNNAQQIIKPEA